MIVDNNFIPVPSRRIIENEHMFKEHILAYVDDPALAYFLHIQGSGVITLASGEKLLVGYAGDNGKKYYSIGKKLIEDGIIKKENMSMQAIIAWMRNNDEEALELMQKNNRFIFFQERKNLEPPKGSSGVGVTPMHSVAVDNSFIPYHLPFWIQVDHFYNDRKDKRLTNIFISQDTGSAIKGLARMDLFLGKGTNAEEIAGRLSSKGKIWTLVPK
jgi:membrane-bound lytic murein transglycosylase A